MRFAACIGTIVLGLLVAVDPAVSQRAAPGSSAPSAGGAAASAEERAAQLRAVVGLVTTPDQAMNIANFEQIVESGDARRIEIAIRTLTSSRDAVLRGIGLRGYLAAYPELTLQIKFDQAVQRVYENSANSSTPFSNTPAPNRFLDRLKRYAFLFQLRFDVKSLTSARGNVQGVGSRHSSEYSVRGDRITFRLEWIFQSSGETCYFDLKPGNDEIIEGTVTCDESSFNRPLIVYAPMF